MEPAVSASLLSVSGVTATAVTTVKADVTRFYLNNLFGFLGGGDLLKNEDTLVEDVGNLIDASENLTTTTDVSNNYTTPSMTAPDTPTEDHARAAVDMATVLQELRDASSNHSDGVITADIDVSASKTYTIPTSALMYQHLIRVQYSNVGATASGSSDSITAQGSTAERTYGFQFTVNNAIEYVVAT